MKKRGQITVFIIVGIIILLIVMLALFLRSQAEERLTPDLIQSITQVPVELRPLRAFTEECIEEVSENAFRELGFKGGYINLEKQGILSSDILPTESDAVKYPDSNLEIPYWWYLKSSNTCSGDCIFSTNRPDIDTIETEVDDYMIENLPGCLENFEIFKEQGFTITPKGEIKPSTVISEGGVSIYVKYPLEAKIQNTVHNFELFYTPLPLDFNKLYNLATEITNSQMNYSFIERQTLNMIAAFSSVNEDKLPPVSESVFNLGAGEVWNEKQVEEDTKTMLMTYVPGMQVFNTLNYQRQFLENNVQQSLYDQMTLPLNLNNEYDDIAARFDYLAWWPIYFDAGHAGLIQPESVFSSFVMLGWQRYNTAYDISFPVIITLTDPEAFNGEGYSLMFALESNLRNNEPMDTEFINLEGTFEFQESLLCNENQRNSGNITMDILDSNTNKPIENAQLTYTCGQESCYIDSSDEKGKIESKLPICHNGVLSFMHPDYFSESQFLTTSLEEERNIEAKLHPFVEKEVELMKFVYSNSQLSSQPIDLFDKEDAIVKLTRIPQNQGEEDYSAVIKLPSEEPIRLVPGTYEVEISSFLHEPVVIPKETRKLQVGFFGELFGADEEYIIPEVVFEDNYPLGGIQLNEKTGYFTIDKNNLYSDNKLRLYIISFNLPLQVEDLNDINKVEDYSSIFRQNLEPEFIR